MKWSFLKSIFVCLTFAAVSILRLCFGFLARLNRFNTVRSVVMAGYEGQFDYRPKMSLRSALHTMEMDQMC